MDNDVQLKNESIKSSFRTLIDSAVIIVTGDVNGDGEVNNRDVAMMNMYLVDKINPAEYQIMAMDVNGDGSINNRDAAALAKYIVGKQQL